MSRETALENRRLSEMAGIHPIAEGGWLLSTVMHGVLMLLAGSVLWLAFNYLDRSDTRVLYNPWTYAVAMPFVLVAISALLRQVVSRVVERTAQVAFLLSLVIHLGLLTAAINVVIGTKFISDFLDQIAEENKAQSVRRAAPQYFSMVGPTGNAGKSDLMRYMPTQHAATEAVSAENTAVQLARTERADMASPVPKPESVNRTYLMERMKSSPQTAAAADLQSQLSRAEPSDLNREQLPIDTPSEMPQSSRPAPELQPQESSTSSGNRRAAGASPQPLPDKTPGEPGLSITSEAVRGPKASASPIIGSYAPDLPARSVLGGPQPNRPTVELPPGADANRNAAAGSSAISSALQALDATGGRSRSKSIDRPFGEPSAASMIDGPANSLTMGITGGAGTGGARQGRAIEIPSQGSGNGQGGEAGGNSTLAKDFGAAVPGTGRGPIAVPGVAGTSEGSSEGNGAMNGLSIDAGAAGSRGDRRSRGSAALPLDIPAPAGVGGLSPATVAGGSLLSRNVPAPVAIPALEMDTQRFPKQEVGGPLAAGSSVPIPKPAFQQRIDRLKDNDMGLDGKIGPQTEQAIERGLEFLARNQRPQGLWRLQDLDKDVLIHSDTAATGLSLLAFQGAGYTHKQFKYSAVVDKGLKYLLAKQQANGDLYIPQDPASDQNAWLYSHAIATLALCEAFGMTQDEELREPAERAVKFMINSQDPQRGGWRYRPGIGSDTSVSGWFMMALKSAQLSGLQVPASTFDGLAKYVETSRSPRGEPYLFRYNPYALDTPEQRHGLQPTQTMTSVGLLMRLYLGWRRDRSEMQAGADYLLRHPPSPGTRDAPLRDTYYWYYATQVMFHMGGERWQKWHSRLHPMLIEEQVTEGELAGSWDPYYPTADLWARYGGRHYVTTMNLLSLEVTYRHLPLYDATAK
ncbi:MAG: hypothetical protein U0892_20205 [Pirellulales bacterium]